MFERFGNWWRENSTEITWWIIGWLCFATMDALGRGQWILAAIDAGLAYWNYTMWRDSDV